MEIAAKIIADDHQIDKIGQQIAHYKIVSLLGGGIGEVWLPLIRATLEMKNSLETALETFEAATVFWGNYLRGKIYLKLNKPDLVAAEFKQILQNRGWAVESPL